MFNFKYLCLAVFLVLFSSCLEKEVIIPPLQIDDRGKTVLIEELTGVRCPNCPSANARLESIKFLYGENIVTVAIHGDLLTMPLAESSQDFRNRYASQLENNFRPFVGKPSIVINRKLFPSFSLIANPLQDQWQSLIESELQKEQTLSITSDIEDTDNTITMNIGIIPVSDIQDNLWLHAMITESHIIDPQQDVTSIIPDYEHNHVLRHMITPIDGRYIGNQFDPNQIYNQSIALDKNEIQEHWVLKNVSLIIFVTNSLNEVEQAGQFRFLE